jgi:hypothetical protein
MKAIETVYKGYRFRSRLEARWAVFFDALGLQWEYEPQGFDLGKGRLYLPDFRVRYPGRDDPRTPRGDEAFDAWFEVKPNLASISNDEWIKMRAWEVQSGHRLYLLDGPPDRIMYVTVGEVCARWSEGACDAEYVVPPTAEMVHSASARDRFGSALWCSRGRMWFDEQENFFRPEWPEDYSELTRAVGAARAARFEHGETTGGRARA